MAIIQPTGPTKPDHVVAPPPLAIPGSPPGTSYGPPTDEPTPAPPAPSKKA